MHPEFEAAVALGGAGTVDGLRNLRTVNTPEEVDEAQPAIPAQGITESTAKDILVRSMVSAPPHTAVSCPFTGSAHARNESRHECFHCVAEGLVRFAEVFLASIRKKARRRKNRQRSSQKTAQFRRFAEEEVPTLPQVPEQSPFHGH